MANNFPCPICDTPVEWSSNAKFRPFCSERCKLIDLGGWMDGEYKLNLNQSDD